MASQAKLITGIIDKKGSVNMDQIQWIKAVRIAACSLLILFAFALEHSTAEARHSENRSGESSGLIQLKQYANQQPGRQQAPPKHIEQLLPATAVIIDAGHGGIDGGASYGTIYEKDINLAVAKKLYAVLQSRGIPTILNRTHDYALSDDNRWHRTSSRHLKDLSQRMGLTREIKHLIFVSLHVNSVPNKSAHGPLVLHQPNGESALLAYHIQEQMNALYAANKRPIAVKSFYVLKYVKSPAVLVELGFISNANDRARLTSPSGQADIAETLAGGILHYFWVN